MKNISVIGVGKLGLPLSLNLESKGFNVLGIDVSENYVEGLNNKTFETTEPFVTQLLKYSKNIIFTTDLKKSIENDIIFIVVKTPSTSDNKYDHSQIDNIANQLKSFGKQEKRKDIIINSTTFPGYCDSLHEDLKDFNYHVSYNPEFIAQGSIIKDQLNCDMVLIGESDEYAGELISDIYLNMCESSPIINRMKRTEAEITKLSINCYLTTKISYANMIGDISLRYKCNPDVVLNAIGTDSRIGNKYLKYGFGFGGPCFPRDNRSLAECGKLVGIDAVISKATDEMNKVHLENQINYFVKNNPDLSTIVEMDYVTYKKESTMIEESQQLEYAIKLKNLGYTVVVNDKREEVINQIKNIL